MPASDLGDHSYFCYLRVDDADAFYAEVVASGVRPTSHIADKPWGIREFAILDLSNNLIRFGQPLG